MLAFTPAILAASYFLTHIQNLYAVSEKKLYRSAQMNSQQLVNVIHQYHIRTIVNLQDPHADQNSYNNEANIADSMHIKYICFPMSAKRYVPSHILDSILNTAENYPKPILVHCLGGADRTGLFCAAWLRKKGEKYIFAKNQLSQKYGHITFLFPSTKAMDSSFIDYNKYLIQGNNVHSN